MEILNFIMIIVGTLWMAVNIARFHRFRESLKDVMSHGRPADSTWSNAAYILLILFLCGYLTVGVMGNYDIMVSLILLGGSIFVGIVLTLMFRLVDTVKDRSLEVTELLIGIIEARDPNLNGHSLYVRDLTMCFFQYLPEEIQTTIHPVSLEYAALMHDIGKLGIPESILNKPNPLSDEEWITIKSHPKIGVKILEPLHSFDAILPWILYHHERIDGKGYYGLSGSEIPIASKIIAIADTYSTITMRRSYKLPRTHEEAIKILKEISGTQLDSELVDIFVHIPKEKLVGCVPENTEVIVELAS